MLTVNFKGLKGLNKNHMFYLDNFAVKMTNAAVFRLSLHSL